MSSESLSRSEIDAKLRELDQKLDELRRDYEQYFVGSRDRPPRNERKQVERLIRELEQTQVTNTSQQFRLRSLVQRFSSYRQKWNRIQRQIEEGTYEPHQKRAERRSKQREANSGPTSDGESDAEQKEDDHVVELDEDFDDIDLEGLEEELQEMDEAGEFEEHVETDRLSEEDFEEAERRRDDSGAPEPSTPRAEADGSNAAKRRPDPADGSEDPEKREKIRKMQEKLGLSSGGDSEDRSSSPRQRASNSTQSSDPDRQQGDRSEGTSSSDLPTGGANRDDLEKMRRNLEQSGSDPESRQQRGNTRESQRQPSSSEGSDRRGRSRRSSDDGETSSSDDDEETEAERLYRKLVSTKREYGEETEHLSLQAVEASMRRQRQKLSDEHTPGDVQFEVVVKDGAVFLQPQFPD